MKHFPATNSFGQDQVLEKNEDHTKLLQDKDDFEWIDGKYDLENALTTKIRRFGRAILNIYMSICKQDVKKQEQPTWSEELLASEKEFSQRQFEQEAERCATQQREADEEFIKSMEEYRFYKDQGIHSERIQEISERSFNKSLTKLEDIETASQTDDGQVEKRTEEFNGKKLTIYDLKGLSFSFLKHAIDFKGRGENYRSGDIGSKMAKSLQDDPSLWARKKNEINEFGGYTVIVNQIIFRFRMLI